MTRVWLLRHAETATPNVFHGVESDVVLSEHGHRQAAAAAEWFRQFTPDVVISSAMRRAVATAEPIAAACAVPHLIEPGLHERRVGDLAGTSFSLSDGPWVETLARWTVGDTAYTTPGAESYDDLVTRLCPIWDRLVTRHDGKRIVLVTHGIVCKILLLTLLDGWGPARWHELGKVHNLSVSEVCQVSPSSWRAERLLMIPPPVAALGDSSAAGRSQA